MAGSVADSGNLRDLVTGRRRRVSKKSQIEVRARADDSAAKRNARDDRAAARDRAATERRIEAFRAQQG